MFCFTNVFNFPTELFFVHSDSEDGPAAEPSDAMKTYGNANM